MNLIPLKPREPVSRSPQFMIIYGETKIGKTESILALPNALHLDLEEGANLYKGNIISVPSIARKLGISHWDTLREIVKELSSIQHQFKFIITDTVDKLEDYAEEHLCLQYEIRHVSDIPHGKGYKFKRDLQFAFIDRLRELGLKVIAIGHRKRTLIGEGETLVQVKELELEGKMKNMLMAKADAIGYMYREEGKLMVSFSTGENESVAAGCRYKYLAGKHIELSEITEEGNHTFHWERVFPELSSDAFSQDVKVSNDKMFNEEFQGGFNSNGNGKL